MRQRVVAFIIVTFRPKPKDLRILLESLRGNPVIIVDNGKTLTRREVGKSTLISQTVNKGYSAAANIGIHHASGLGAKWFVVFNQDFRITRVSALLLIRTLRQLSPCVGGPYAGALDPKRWTTILPSERLDYLTGSCMAIHEKVVSKVGYFHEPYFLYYEDVDYCIRARDAGFNLVRLELPDIGHKETATLGRGSLTHTYYLARNHLLFVQRLGTTRVKLYEVLRFPKTLMEHVVRKETGALRGIRDFGIRRFGKLKGRI